MFFYTTNLKSILIVVWWLHDNATNDLARLYSWTKKNKRVFRRSRIKLRRTSGCTKVLKKEKRQTNFFQLFGIKGTKRTLHRQILECTVHVNISAFPLHMLRRMKRESPGDESSEALYNWHESLGHEQVPWKSFHSVLLPAMHLSIK